MSFEMFPDPDRKTIIINKKQDCPSCLLPYRKFHQSPCTFRCMNKHQRRHNLPLSDNRYLLSGRKYILT